MDPRVIVIAAVAENNVIGNERRLPWRLPADVYRFKTLTTGHTVVMGRITWESIPSMYRPLAKRRNIVLTRQSDFSEPGAEIFHSLSDVLGDSKGEKVFIMGGQRVYNEALPLADELRLTFVKASPRGNTRFPDLQGLPFTKTDEMTFPADEKNVHPFSFAIFRRNPGNMSYVFLANARKPEQWANMERIELDDVCPFCPAHLHEYHEPPVICQNDHWVVTKNQWPYANTQHHFLLIAKTHTERLEDLTGQAWTALGQLAAQVEDMYSIRGGGLVLRFGDPTFNGATVRHLHVHLASAAITDSKSPAYLPVRFRVG